MASVNKAIILGRLGNDPELKYTPNGKAVCNLSVATTQRWTKDGKANESTEWHRVNVWGKVAENCNKCLGKGSQVFVEGSITTRSWDDKDGKKRYSTEIKADNVQFLNSNKDTNAALESAHNAAGGAEIATNTNFAQDDIPF